MVQVVYSGLSVKVEYRSGSDCLQWVVSRG